MKKAIKIIIIVAIVAVVATGAILGGIFGTISASAKGSNNYTREAAETIARDFLKEKLGEGEYIVTDYDYDIEHIKGLNQSYYVHEFEFRKGMQDDIDVYVNAKTGEATFYNYD